MKILKLVSFQTPLCLIIIINTSLYLAAAVKTEVNAEQNLQTNEQNRKRSNEIRANKLQSRRPSRSQRPEEVSQVFGKQDNYPLINKNYIRSNFTSGFISSHAHESKNGPKVYSELPEELNMIDSGAGLINPKKFNKQPYNRSPSYDIILSEDKATKSRPLEEQVKPKKVKKNVSESSQLSASGTNASSVAPAVTLAGRNPVKDLLLDSRNMKISNKNDTEIQLIDAMIDILAQSIERRRKKTELSSGSREREQADVISGLKESQTVTDLDPIKFNPHVIKTNGLGASRISREDNDAVQEIDYNPNSNFDIETTKVGYNNQRVRTKNRTRIKSTGKAPGESKDQTRFELTNLDVDFNPATSNKDLVLVKPGKTEDQTVRTELDESSQESGKKRRPKKKKRKTSASVSSNNTTGTMDNSSPEDRLITRSQNQSAQRVLYPYPVVDSSAELGAHEQDQMSLLRAHRPLVAQDLLHVRRRQHSPHLHQPHPNSDEENQSHENMFASPHPYFRPPLGSNSDGSAERMRLNPNMIDDNDGSSRYDPNQRSLGGVAKSKEEAEQSYEPGERRSMPPVPMLRPGYKLGPLVPPYNGQQVDWIGAPEHRIGSAVEYPSSQALPQSSPYVSPLHQLLLAAKNQQAAAMAYEKRRLDHQMRWRDEALRRQHDANIERQRQEVAKQQQQEQEQQQQQQPQKPPEKDANVSNENESNMGAPNDQPNTGGANNNNNEENAPETNRKQQEEVQQSDNQNNESGPASQQQENESGDSSGGSNGNDADMKNFQNFAGPDTDFTDLFPPGILSKAEIEEMRKQQQDQQRREQEEEEQRRNEGGNGEGDNNEEQGGGEQSNGGQNESGEQQQQQQEPQGDGAAELKARSNSSQPVEEQKSQQQQAVVVQPAIAVIQVPSNNSISPASASVSTTMSLAGGGSDRPPSFLFNNNATRLLQVKPMDAPMDNRTYAQAESVGSKTRRNIIAKQQQQQAHRNERDYNQLRPDFEANNWHRTQSIAPTEFDDVVDRIVRQTPKSVDVYKPQLWTHATSLVPVRTKQTFRSTPVRLRHDDKNNIADERQASEFSSLRQMLESSALVVDGDSDIEDNVLTLNRA